MQAYYICQYCDNRWRSYHNIWHAPSCEKCKDKNICVITDDQWDRDVFGYEKKGSKTDPTASQLELTQSNRK